MADIIFSFNIVAPIFLLVAIGYFLTRIHVWNEEFLKVANKICFNVFLPVLLFYNIYKSDFSEVFNPKLILFIIVSVTLLFIAGSIIVPMLTKDGGRRGAVIQALFRGNYLLLGVPICQSMYGDAGGAAASVAAAFVIPYFNVLATLVLSIYSRDNVTTWKSVLIKIAKNPLIIGSVLGMLAALSGIKLPAPIEKTLMDMKGLATPFALLILGGDFKLRALASNLMPIITTTFARLLLVPAIMIVSAVLLGFSGASLGVLISVYCTPVAVSSYVMTRQMHGDYELAGQLVVSTTFFSMFSIFIVVYMMRIAGLV